jgi:hypothetical protein
VGEWAGRATTALGEEKWLVISNQQSVTVRTGGSAWSLLPLSNHPDLTTAPASWTHSLRFAWQFILRNPRSLRTISTIAAPRPEQDTSPNFPGGRNGKGALRGGPARPGLEAIRSGECGVRSGRDTARDSAETRGDFTLKATVGVMSDRPGSISCFAPCHSTKSSKIVLAGIPGL